MARCTSIKRAASVAATIIMSLGVAGCGFLFSHAPPEGHERMSSFNCTESNAGPIIDIIWGALNVLGALQAASDPDAYENSSQIVAVGLSWGVISGTAAGVGFDKSKKCRTARRSLAERQSQGLTLPAPMPDVAVPAAVVVSPATDTVRVGGRLQLLATANASSGAPLPGRVYFWTSSNDAIASVNGAGLVTAHAPGTVVIAARTGSVVGTAQLVVVVSP